MPLNIIYYIVVGLLVPIDEQSSGINGQITSTATTFMGYNVEYEDIDVYTCTATSTAFVVADTSTVCLTTTTSTTTSTTSTSTTTSTTTTTMTTTTATTTTTTTTSTSTTTTATTTTTTTTSTTTTTTATTTTTTTTTTTATTTTVTTTTVTTQTTTSTTSLSPWAVNGSVFIPLSCPPGTMGSSCNISTDACTLSQPCLNLAQCYPNISLPLGYQCICVIGFQGIHCEIDIRTCSPTSPCLSGGACNETLNTSGCICPAGKVGEHCEDQMNICANISCQNSAVCQSIYTNWSCLCTNNELYSGIYCEIKSSSLRMKEIYSRSFAGVAIGCISTVISFVLIMDLLKYCCDVDPADYELRSRRRHREIQRKKPFKPKHPPVITRFEYINA